MSTTAPLSPTHPPVADLSTFTNQVVKSHLHSISLTTPNDPTIPTEEIEIPSQTVTISQHELCFRLLDRNDFTKGYMTLLSQLTQISENQDAFHTQFDRLFQSALKHSYIIIVAENIKTNKIVGTATLLLEHKFIRNFSIVGHIEDVVVDQSIRRCGVGLTLVQTLTDIGEKLGCYKTILDCSPDNEGFYVECGFINKGVQMGKYF